MRRPLAPAPVGFTPPETQLDDVALEALQPRHAALELPPPASPTVDGNPGPACTTSAIPPLAAASASESESEPAAAAAAAGTHQQAPCTDGASAATTKSELRRCLAKRLVIDDSDDDDVGEGALRTGPGINKPSEKVREEKELATAIDAQPRPASDDTRDTELRPVAAAVPTPKPVRRRRGSHSNPEAPTAANVTQPPGDALASSADSISPNERTSLVVRNAPAEPSPPAAVSSSSRADRPATGSGTSRRSAAAYLPHQLEAVRSSPDGHRVRNARVVPATSSQQQQQPPPASLAGSSTAESGTPARGPISRVPSAFDAITPLSSALDRRDSLSHHDAFNGLSNFDVDPAAAAEEVMGEPEADEHRGHAAELGQFQLAALNRARGGLLGWTYAAKETEIAYLMFAHRDPLGRIVRLLLLMITALPFVAHSRPFGPVRGDDDEPVAGSVPPQVTVPSAALFVFVVIIAAVHVLVGTGWVLKRAPCLHALLGISARRRAWIAELISVPLALMPALGGTIAFGWHPQLCEPAWHASATPFAETALGYGMTTILLLCDPPRLIVALPGVILYVATRIAIMVIWLQREAAAADDAGHLTASMQVVLLEAFVPVVMCVVAEVLRRRHFEANIAAAWEAACGACIVSSVAHIAASGSDAQLGRRAEEDPTTEWTTNGLPFSDLVFTTLSPAMEAPNAAARTTEGKPQPRRRPGFRPMQGQSTWWGCISVVAVRALAHPVAFDGRTITTAAEEWAVQRTMISRIAAEVAAEMKARFRLPLPAAAKRPATATAASAADRFSKDAASMIQFISFGGAGECVYVAFVPPQEEERSDLRRAVGPRAYAYASARLACEFVCRMHSRSNALHQDASPFAGLTAAVATGSADATSFSVDRPCSWSEVAVSGPAVATADALVAASTGEAPAAVDGKAFLCPATSFLLRSDAALVSALLPKGQQPAAAVAPNSAPHPSSSSSSSRHTSSSLASIPGVRVLELRAMPTSPSSGLPTHLLSGTIPASSTRPAANRRWAQDLGSDRSSTINIAPYAGAVASGGGGGALNGSVSSAGRRVNPFKTTTVAARDRRRQNLQRDGCTLLATHIPQFPLDALDPRRWRASSLQPVPAPWRWNCVGGGFRFADDALDDDFVDRDEGASSAERLWPLPFFLVLAASAGLWPVFGDTSRMQEAAWAFTFVNATLFVINAVLMGVYTHPGPAKRAAATISTIICMWSSVGVLYLTDDPDGFAAAHIADLVGVATIPLLLWVPSALPTTPVAVGVATVRLTIVLLVGGQPHGHHGALLPTANISDSFHAPSTSTDGSFRFPPERDGGDIMRAVGIALLDIAILTTIVFRLHHQARESFGGVMNAQQTEERWNVARVKTERFTSYVAPGLLTRALCARVQRTRFIAENVAAAKGSGPAKAPRPMSPFARSNAGQLAEGVAIPMPDFSGSAPAPSGLADGFFTRLGGASNTRLTFRAAVVALTPTKGSSRGPQPLQPVVPSHEQQAAMVNDEPLDPNNLHPALRKPRARAKGAFDSDSGTASTNGAPVAIGAGPSTGYPTSFVLGAAAGAAECDAGYRAEEGIWTLAGGALVLMIPVRSAAAAAKNNGTPGSAAGSVAGQVSDEPVELLATELLRQVVANIQSDSRLSDTQFTRSYAIGDVFGDYTRLDFSRFEFGGPAIDTVLENIQRKMLSIHHGGGPTNNNGGADVGATATTTSSGTLPKKEHPLPFAALDPTSECSSPAGTSAATTGGGAGVYAPRLTPAATPHDARPPRPVRK